MRSVILVIYNDVTIKIIDKLKLNFCRVCSDSTGVVLVIEELRQSTRRIFFKTFQEKKKKSVHAFFVIGSLSRHITEMS